MEKERRRKPFSKTNILLLGCAGDGSRQGSYLYRHALRTVVEEITIFEPVREILVRAFTMDAKGSNATELEQFAPDKADRLRPKLVAMELLDPHQIGRDEPKQWQHCSFQVEADGKTIVLAATDVKQRDEWAERIRRRTVALAKAHGFGWNRAAREWEELPQQRAFGELEEPEPEPESQSLALSGVTQHHNLERAQAAAKLAVAAYECWKARSFGHASTIDRTDRCLAVLSGTIEKIRENERWFDSDTRKRACDSIRKYATEALECVRAERALREIRPDWTLRAAVYGVGEVYPQLSCREVIATARCYLSARGSSLPLESPKDAVAQFVDIELRRFCDPSTDVTKQDASWRAAEDLQMLRNGQGLGGATVGLVQLAMTARVLLLNERDRMNQIFARELENTISESIEGCRPHVDCEPPNATKLTALKKERHQLEKSFKAAEFKLEELMREIKFREELRGAFPRAFRQDADQLDLVHLDTAEQRQQFELERERAYSRLREKNKEVDAELKYLASHGAGHWPELNVDVPDLSKFKSMDFLNVDGLSLRAYNDLEKKEKTGRNEVHFGTIDGNPVVLKEHDVTETTVQKVEEEVVRLHRMRHPNIIEYQAVFLQREEHAMKLFIQMPRLPYDFKQWLLKKCKKDPPPADRRKILFGVLRGVARVHEFSLTHNDIKLDNILVDNDGEAVLTDFEMCREMTGLSCSSFGGTLCYTAPERQPGMPGHNKPTVESDMYSVGVVLLMAFSPEHIDALERRETRPRDVFQRVKASVPTSLQERLRCLLADHATQRPKARDILDDECGFFARGVASSPSWWSISEHANGHGWASPVTDGETWTRLKALIEPTRPDEFGLGLDQGEGWKRMGFVRKSKDGPLRIPAGHPDAVPGSKPSVEMVKAWRMQNLRVWQRYDAGVARVSDSISRGPALYGDDLPTTPDTLNLPPQLQLAKRRGFCIDGEDAARKDVNETFLMHGIPKQNLVKVMTNGLHEHFSGSNKGSLFGEGIYFGETIEKVDQYCLEADHTHANHCAADEKEPWMEPLHAELYPTATDHPGDVCYVLVCRVAMGYSIRTQTRVWNSSTGDWEKQCVAMDGEAASSNSRVFATPSARELVPLPRTEDTYPIHYHSLVAETGMNVKRFREFVVMHGDYVYPEFIVAYRRTIVAVDEPGPEPEPEPEVGWLGKRSIIDFLDRRAQGAAGAASAAGGSASVPM